jgi:ribosomal RNA-processing protein 12
MQELSNTFKKVSTMLTQNLKATPTPLTHTTLDLLVLLIPHISPTDGTKLFTIVFTDNAIASPDGTVQKKAYRILARLVERGIVDGLQESDGKNFRVESVFARCVEITSNVNVAAKRASFPRYSHSIFVLNITLGSSPIPRNARFSHS